MSGVVSAIIGGPKQQKVETPAGPTEAERAAQQESRQRARADNAEADRVTSLALNARSRRQSLSFTDERRKSTLG